MAAPRRPDIRFAIPSNTVTSVARKLVASGKVPQAGRAYLGVEVSTIVGGGVLVGNVQPGGPADKAGIHPDDVITAVAGHDTPTADVLTSVLQTLRPGQSVPVELSDQAGQQKSVNVTLGSQPGR